MIRTIAGIVGLILVGAAAHDTIMATGGYEEPSAILTTALALGVAVGAAAIGAAAGHGRVMLAVAIGLGLAAAEGYALLSTSERVIASSEAEQALLRDAKKRHENAEARLAAAREAAQKSGEVPPISSRAAAAQAAVDVAVKAIREQAALPGCRENCKQLLLAQATDARRELNAAQAEMAKVLQDLRQNAEAELANAQQVLATSPMPSSAAPLADRLGVRPWLLDILAAALLSIGVNGLGGALIALAAYGRAQLPSHDLLHSAKRTFLAGTANDNGPALPLAPGCVSSFVGQRLERAESGRIEVGDLYQSYVAWCRSSGLQPFDMIEFGDQLKDATDAVGIRTRAHRDKVFLVGVELRAA